jgi:hypothetical protein
MSLISRGHIEYLFAQGDGGGLVHLEVQRAGGEVGGDVVVAGGEVVDGEAVDRRGLAGAEEVAHRVVVLGAVQPMQRLPAGVEGLGGGGGRLGGAGPVGVGVGDVGVGRALRSVGRVGARAGDREEEDGQDWDAHGSHRTPWEGEEGVYRTRGETILLGVYRGASRPPRRASRARAR